MTPPEHQRAFISAHARVPLIVRPKAFCARCPYHRRASHRWRCSLQEDTPDEAQPLPSKLPIPDEAQPLPSKLPIPDEPHAQVEGVVSLDSVDANFEEVLSKKWDTLDMFDGGPHDTRTERQSPKGLFPEEDEQKDPGETGTSAEGSKEESQKKNKRGRKAKKMATEEPQEQTSESEKWSGDARWYFVQVKPGCEQSCAISIRNMSESVEDAQIHEVLVPTTKIMRLTKGGKAVSKEERFFPGYIIVLVSMSRFGYTQILRVPNIQCFMNDPNRDKKKNDPFRPPLPVKDSEMKLVFQKMREAESGKPEVKTAVRPGDPVEITSGAYRGNKGRVTEVKPDLNVVKTELVIYGRISAVELEFHQVRVIEEADLEEYLTQNDTVREKIDTEAVKLGKELKSSAEAGIASPEDDLMSLLNDIEDGSPKSDYTTQYNFGDEEGFAAAESKDDTKETISDALFPGSEDPRKESKTRKEKKEKKTVNDEELFGDFLFDSGRNDDEGLLSSNDDLASFLNGEDDADLWQLDEGEKRPSSMFDDTDDGFELLSDEKQGASSLIDEAEHPFNSPDDGFVEVDKTRHAKRRSRPSPAKVKDADVFSVEGLKGVTISDSADYESSFKDTEVDFELMDEENEDESELRDGDADFEEELEKVQRDFEIAKSHVQDGGAFPSFSRSKDEAVLDEPKKPKAGCSNLPRHMSPWPEEDELPLVPPEDVHRIGGEAMVQDLYAELRRVEKEDDRKYELPPRGYDESEPIIEVAVEAATVDISKPNTREWQECEEFDYEEVKEKSRAVHKARKEARRRRQGSTSSDSSKKTF
ncbi:unnamed protein product [Agarophyton chilense]|eukprot:gb/GEZJ01004298.1/.p1 GENE.gb/GEZJ01004298.1/~~gb/GEZJ01004298.1/.p1  ORF type:complete len:814 (+),score=179.20 gb/GEZJ01004298.1/:1117-3558(+)